MRKMSIKGVKLKSESFFSISPGVLELWRKNLRGADSAPPPVQIGLSAQMTKSLAKSVINLYSNVACSMLGVGNQQNLSNDLECDPFLNTAMQRFTCDLYCRFGAFLAPVSVGIIATAGRQQTCLPRWRKELAARIKGIFVYFCVVDCSLEIGWSPIFVKILGHNSWS